MLHEFLTANSGELIERCRSKVAARFVPQGLPDPIEYGIPLFLRQLIETLRTEPARASRGHRNAAEDEAHLQMGSGATRHGNDMLRRGYTVEQVIRDYGDLCQAVTELAIQKDAPVTPTEFQTLNLCLDNAIASAVTEFARGRDESISETGSRELTERLAFLAHEQRNFLNTATLAFAAIKSGGVAPNGATSAVLDRSLAGLRNLIDRALVEARLCAGAPARLERVDLARFIQDSNVGAQLGARSSQCEFLVAPVDPALACRADEQLLYSALSNLLQNAFKYTRHASQVHLRAYAKADRALIEVEDRCGGLSPGNVEAMFVAFAQFAPDRSGLGIGLSIARRAVEACGGRLEVRNVPDVGCVFTIDLPRVP
jgi:signal transduction histidine kinase